MRNEKYVCQAVSKKKLFPNYTGADVRKHFTVMEDDL